METTVEPETLNKWFPVYRDFAIVTVGLFMLIYETIFTTPNPLIITGAGSLLALPAVMRIDSRRRGNGHKDERDTREDRWSGLP